MNKLKELFDLYFTFLKIGSFTIGGGLAMMPMMSKELIEKRHWISDEELLDYYAVGQSTPGIVAVNVSTFVGYKQMGVVGGIFSTAGMVTTSLIVIIILAGLINSISDYPYIQKALSGINVAVAALMTHIVYNFAKKSVKKWWHVICLLASFTLIFFFKLPSFYIIITSLLAGCLITKINLDKAKKMQNSEEA